MTQETMKRRATRREKFKTLYNSLTDQNTPKAMKSGEAKQVIADQFSLSPYTVHQILHDDKYGQRNKAAK